MSEVEGYLRMIVQLRGKHVHAGGPYSCMEDFILRNGRSYSAAPLPKRVRRMTPKQCFANCTQLALAHDDFTYVEGYAFNIIPTAHAWCIDRAGTVVDPTWEYDSKISYFGVPFSTDYLREQIDHKNFYGLIDSPETGWPLIAGTHREFAQAA